MDIFPDIPAWFICSATIVFLIIVIWDITRTS